LTLAIFNKGNYRNKDEKAEITMTRATSESIFVLVDCRGKEKLVVTRKGGDVALEVQDLEGNVKFVMWFQLKRPCGKHYDWLIDVLRSTKKHLIQPAAVLYHETFESLPQLVLSAAKNK
jgi:hypothetical protein